MKSFFLSLGFCLTTLLAVVANAQRIGHYDEVWKTIHTDHFDVIVNADQLDLGLYYARAAEQAYQNLAGVFTNLTEKIVIVVNDTTDVSNGYATRIPYPHIMAFSVPVGDHDALSEAGDWAHILITHELTHVLQFEPATGFYSYLRPIFGSIVAPNMLLPSWWKEGMAVEMETEFSTTGRLRSTYQDATLRSLVLDKKLFDYDLAQTNEILPSWPYGARPYLFGSLFFSQLVSDTKNLKSISYLADRTGERVPYFVEEPMLELTGSNYENTYNNALSQVQINGLAQADALKTLPLSKLTLLKNESEYSLRPAYSQKFHLLAYLQSQEDETELVVFDENLKKMDLKDLPSGNISSVDFHPTEKKILYSKTSLVDSKYKFSDLYIYDIEKQKSEQLTFSQRARAASFSDSGEQAVFITTFSGETQIRLLDLKTKAIQFVISTSVSNRYESPVLWDDKTILVSKIDEDGRYQLIKIDLPTKVETVVPLDFKQIRFLKKINGKLYFVSSKNGVNNIYVSEDLITATPITHLLNGTWSYAINPDTNTAWASVMTSSGFKVATVELSKFDKDLPIIENLIKNRYLENKKEFISKPLHASEYEAGSYLLPSYWIPFISTSSSSKGIFFQAETSGHDPLNVHEYSLVASYDSELQKGNFSGIYTNSTQEIPFQLSSNLRSIALGSNANVVQTTTHAVSLLPDVFALDKSLLMAIGVQYQITDFTSSTTHAGPFISAAYQDYSQNIFQVSPEKGWGGFLKFEKNYKLADDTGFVAQDYEKATFSVLGFAASDLLPKHHAFKFRLSGLLTFENVLNRYGSSSSTTFYEQDGLAAQYVMRGYAPAQFFGRNIWNTNLEYRFPVTTIERGSGTDAYFLKRIVGAVVLDGIGVDGFGLTENLLLHPLKTNESIWSSGLELKLESTMGNVLPVNFVLGYYLPYSPLYAAGSQIGLSLQIGGL